MSERPTREQVTAWADEVVAVGERIGRHFARSEPRGRAVGYVRGLLSGTERKNGWQLAEHLGDPTPDGVQHLLARADWDVDAVRDDLIGLDRGHRGGSPMPLNLAAVFADLPDPRRDTKNKVHRLSDILTIATCAVIAGAEGWDEIAEYGQLKEPFFRRFLELPGGIPSHDTFNRVFAKLDPEAFADRFGHRMARACEATGLVQVAIDGKSARRAPKGTFTGCLHRVEAWAVESRLILGQRSVPEGGHEITTIPELLAALDLKGAVVTIDAAGCQKATVQQIRDQGGEW
jgi:hypothetical protein